MTAIVFGLDISHHQDINLSLQRAKEESGIEFVFIKSSEGSNFVDPEFTANLAEALRVGQFPAAYHYLRGNASATTQVECVRRVVPREVPVIPDVEAGSGGVPLVREFVDKLRAAGYRVPFLYLPKWYWEQLGRPDLRGLPPLWSSRYPDNIIGTLAEEWDDVPSTYWNGYGGLDVAVLQFTSSARIAGHQPLDANAFRGTRQNLAEVLGYASPSHNNKKEDEDDMYAIAREKDKPEVWLGNYITRRWVSEAELVHLEARFGSVQLWEPGTIQVLGDETAESKARRTGSGGPVPGEPK